MKVKSESEVAQSCPTLRDPMACSPPGSLWDFPGKRTGVGCHCLLQVIANQWLPGAPGRGGWVLIRKGQKEMVVIEMF